MSRKRDQRNRRRPRGPGYLPGVLDLAARVAVPGTFTEVAVLHDDWCALLAGRGPCDCNPTVQTMAEYRQGQAEKN